MKRFLLALIFLLACAIPSLATEITVGSSQWFPGSYRYAGTTATLRIYYSQSFLSSENVSVVGSAVGSNGWFKQIPCTISANTLNCESFTFYSTINSNKPNTRFFAVLYDQSAARRETLMGDASGWIVPASPTTTTVAQLLNAQGTGIVNPPISYLNSQQTQALINTAIGTLNDASSTIKGRTYLDVDPTVPSHPEAVGSNSARVPSAGAYYYALNYSSFAAAVTAMGTTVPVRLIVSEQMAVAADVTATPNIQLQFVGNGRLIVATTKTVTIQGSLIASPSQWIFDVSASGAVVSFSGNTAVNILDTRWWGAKWDDTTDDTLPIQAAIDAMGVRVALRFPSNGYAKTTVPLRIWTKYSPKFFSDANSDPFLSDNNGPGIDYRGADGTAAIQWYNVLGGTWDGIGVSFNHGANVAQTGIDIDLFPGGTVIGGRTIAYATTTAGTFKNFGMNTENNGVNATGIRLAYTSNNNCENMTFERVNVVINGTNSSVSTNLNRGVAFKVGGGGGGANAFNLRFDSVSWTFATYGIQVITGSGIITSGESQRATVDFKLSGTWLIQDFRPENGRQFLYGFGTITLIENEINGNWDDAFPVVYVAGASQLQMIGNSYETNDTVTAVDADPAGGCQFAGMGNLWPGGTPPTLANFAKGAASLGHVSRLGLLVGGQTSAIRLGSAVATADLPTVQFGNGTIVYGSEAAPGSIGPTIGSGAPLVRINGAWQALGQNVVSTVVAGGTFGVPGSVPGMVETAEIVGPSGGCGFGDRLVVGAPAAVGANYILSAYVSSTNHFKIRWTQISGAAADPNAAGGTYVVTVWR